MTDSHGAILPAFTEHRVRHAGGNLYVRDFPGSGPAFVLLHGFPDNSYIYNHLIPHLAGPAAEPSRSISSASEPQTSRWAPSIPSNSNSVI